MIHPKRNDGRQLSAYASFLRKASLVRGAIVIAFAFATPFLMSSSSSEGDGQEPAAQKRDGSHERFDFLVRADFFAGYAGDQAALERAMKVCEEALAKNPNHAEALVWHGGGLMFLAGQAFQRADIRKGTDLWDRGLSEMDRAATLEPDNVGVLIPRGATLLAVSRFADVPVRRPLLEKAVKDYEKVLQLQKDYFNTLSAHARSELLFGLAEGWMRLGNNDKARAYFTRIVDECKGSARQAQAAQWLQKGTLPSTSAMSCTGCHAR